MIKVAIEVIGWTAAVLMLSAYVLLTTGRVTARSRIYQWFNVLSGAGFIINSGWNGAYPSAAINVFWMAIGVYGVVRISLARRLGSASESHAADR